MLKKLIFLCSIISSVQIDAYSWSDFKKDVTSAANKVANTVVDAANSVANFAKDLFSDNKVSRSLDYGIRLAAFEAAHKVATGVLEVSKAAAKGTLIAARETANGSMILAEQFLDKVVTKLSSTTLKVGAQTASGVLEGVRAGTNAVLEGTRYVITNALGAIDLNEIYYQGQLRQLANGVLGNLQIKGRVVAPFDVKVNFDTNDIWNSLENLAKKILTDFISIIKGDSSKASTNLAEGLQAAADLAALNSYVAQINAERLKAEEELLNLQKKISEADQQILEQSIATRSKISELGNAKFDELINITKDPTKTSQERLIAKKILAEKRQEYYKWRDEEKKKTQEEEQKGKQEASSRNNEIKNELDRLKMQIAEQDTLAKESKKEADELLKEIATI